MLDGGRPIYPGKSLEPKIMALNRLYVMGTRESAVTVHDERDMLRDRALPESTNKELSQPLDCPFCRRRLQEPCPQVR